MENCLSIVNQINFPYAIELDRNDLCGPSIFLEIIYFLLKFGIDLINSIEILAYKLRIYIAIE